MGKLEDKLVKAQERINQLQKESGQLKLLREGIGSFEIAELSDDDEEVSATLKGTALKEGHWGGIFYPEDEIKETAHLLEGVPLVIEHKKGIKDIVGQVTDSWWDEDKETLDFEAEVLSDEIAELLKRQLITGVSVGHKYHEFFTQEGKSADNIRYYELALTNSPAVEDGIRQVLHEHDIDLDLGGEPTMTDKKQEEEQDYYSGYYYGYPKKKYYYPKGYYGYPYSDKKGYGYYPYGYYGYPKKKGKYGYYGYPAEMILEKLVNVLEERTGLDIAPEDPEDFDMSLPDEQELEGIEDEKEKLEEFQEEYGYAYGGYPVPKLTDIVKKLVKVVEDELDVSLEDIELQDEDEYAEPEDESGTAEEKEVEDMSKEKELSEEESTEEEEESVEEEPEEEESTEEEPKEKGEEEDTEETGEESTEPSINVNVDTSSLEEKLDEYGKKIDNLSEQLATEEEEEEGAEEESVEEDKVEEEEEDTETESQPSEKEILDKTPTVEMLKEINRRRRGTALAEEV